MGSVRDLASGLPSFDFPWSGAGAVQPVALDDFQEQEEMGSLLDFAPSSTYVQAEIESAPLTRNSNKPPGKLGSRLAI
jgi:hypothetical protein